MPVDIIITYCCAGTVRSCWGPDLRHTETVLFFLKNGVPLDDIYDTCMEMTKNSATIEMLKGFKDEL